MYNYINFDWKLNELLLIKVKSLVQFSIHSAHLCKLTAERMNRSTRTQKTADRAVQGLSNGI